MYTSSPCECFIYPVCSVITFICGDDYIGHPASSPDQNPKGIYPLHLISSLFLYDAFML